MKSKHILYTTVIFVSLALTSCGTQVATTQPVATATPLPTSTQVTITPSAVKIPTRTPTLTPLPTLSPENALEAFVNMIENDTECIFPCWLGVIPGETEFNDVKNVFSQFSEIAYTEYSSEWASIRVYFPNFKVAVHGTTTTVYPARGGKVSKVRVYAGVDPKSAGNIAYSNEAYQKMWQPYFAPGIFARYGPPEKIFLDTTLVAADPATSHPFSLWIIYSQQGFMIRYNGLNIKTGENIRACPMQSSIQIEIWDTETSTYEEFIKDDKALATSLGPQPIETVTDFDIESFYETFKDGHINTCFETPASIWPPSN